MGVDPAECPESSLFVIVTRSRPRLNLLGEGAYRMPQFHSRQAAVAGGIKPSNYLPNALMTREARERAWM